MEVHTHSHAHGKKNWKSYFWEFLMLFLAVFTGFLAENQREHMVEHQRARVYAKTLYEELKKDTSDINRTIQHIKYTVEKLDSFCLLGTERVQRNISTGILYYYASYTTGINLYASENTTIEQLKSSGNLRLMGNNIAQLINEYGKKLNKLNNEYALTRPEFIKIEELYFKLFDGYATATLLSSKNRTSYRDSLLNITIPLINDDPLLMKEFIGWQKFEINIYLTHISDFLTPLKQTATALLSMLKEEYHLE